MKEEWFQYDSLDGLNQHSTRVWETFEDRVLNKNPRKVRHKQFEDQLNFIVRNADYFKVEDEKRQTRNMRRRYKYIELTSPK